MTKCSNHHHATYISTSMDSQFHCIFSTSARHKFLIFATWKLPQLAGTDGLELEAPALNSHKLPARWDLPWKNDAIYHDTKRSGEKGPMLSGITFLVKKNRCKPLIPQPFDSALWKLHFQIFKTHQNHQKDFLID